MLGRKMFGREMFEREKGTHCFTRDESCQKNVSHSRGMKELGYCLMNQATLAWKDTCKCWDQLVQEQ